MVVHEVCGVCDRSIDGDDDAVARASYCLQKWGSEELGEERAILLLRWA